MQSFLMWLTDTQINTDDFAQLSGEIQKSEKGF